MHDDRHPVRDRAHKPPPSAPDQASEPSEVPRRQLYGALALVLVLITAIAVIVAILGIAAATAVIGLAGMAVLLVHGVLTPPKDPWASFRSFFPRR